MGEADGAGDLSVEATARSSRFTNLVRLVSVDSTNRVAADAARDGAPEGLVVIADEQLQGRGRKGRTWLSPPGGALLCSMLFRPHLELADLHVLGPLVGLAAIDAVAATTDAITSLKWPNDVLLGEKKLAGILSELVESRDAPESAASSAAVVVGIGLNLAWPPGWGEWARGDDGEALSARATTLEEATGTPPDRDATLGALLSSLESRYGRLQRDGVVALMDEYRAACSTIGRSVEITMQTGSFVARATAVADDGRLEVIGPHGVRYVDAADVVHLRDES